MLGSGRCPACSCRVSNPNSCSSSGVVVPRAQPRRSHAGRELHARAEVLVHDVLPRRARALAHRLARLARQGAADRARVRDRRGGLAAARRRCAVRAAAQAFVYENSRAMALFKDPNVLGSFLVPAALILAEELLRPSLLRARRSTKLVLFILVARRRALLVLARVDRQPGDRPRRDRGGLRRAARRRAPRADAGRRDDVRGHREPRRARRHGQARASCSRARRSRATTRSASARRTSRSTSPTRHPLGVGPGQFEQYSLCRCTRRTCARSRRWGSSVLVLVAALLLGDARLRNAQRRARHRHLRRRFGDAARRVGRLRRLRLRHRHASTGGTSGSSRRSSGPGRQGGVP